MKKRLLVDVVIPNDERRIIKMLCNGHSAQYISDKFGISKRTLETNLYKMRIEYRCRNTIHLIVTLLKEGII